EKIDEQNRVACFECDLMIELPDNIDQNQSVVCPRCHHKIFSGHQYSIDSVRAFVLTALIIFIISNSFSFLTFETQGQSVIISLFGAASELYRQDFKLLSFLVFMFVIALPFFILLLLLLVLLPIGERKHYKLFIFLGKIITLTLPWVMTEVFLISVFVALIKVVAMADITLGVSFWAYILFTISFIFIFSIFDNHRLWEWIEYKSKH
ncbi:MAG: paraquat-inducible protein A, partial [Pseudomonadota bacterium]